MFGCYDHGKDHLHPVVHPVHAVAHAVVLHVVHPHHPLQRHHAYHHNHHCLCYFFVLANAVVPVQQEKCICRSNCDLHACHWADMPLIAHHTLALQ